MKRKDLATNQYVGAFSVSQDNIIVKIDKSPWPHAPVSCTFVPLLSGLQRSALPGFQFYTKHHILKRYFSNFYSSIT